MSKERATPKTGTVLFQTGQPLKFIEHPDSAPGKLEPSESEATTASEIIGRALVAYGKAARALLEGKYAGAKDIAPLHMRGPCNLTVVGCTDGVLVRYDSVSTVEEARGRFAEINESLTEVAPKLSDFMLHFPSDPETYVPGINVPQLTVARTKPDGTTEEMARVGLLLYASTTLHEGSEVPLSPARPPCLVAVENEFDFQLGGLVLPSDPPAKAVAPEAEQFVAHTRIKLPVGWQNIQVYPPPTAEHWKREYAPLWAELDILAAAAQRNSMTSALKGLDSRGETRKHWAALLGEFEGLLQGPEEPVHQFLKKHPQLLCPTYDAVWSKLPFGETVSDFVFREAPCDYQLVEIEAPVRELFRRDGQQRQELTHAIDQTRDWVRHIEDNRKKVEETLPGISTNPRTLVVIGRSMTLTDENRRKLVTLQAQQNKLRILTYDDVLANARSVLERILGPLTMFVSQNVDVYFFGGAPPSALARS